MILRTWGHACVSVEDAGHVVVLDPGVWSTTSEVLERATAIVVTHDHVDHLDVVAVVHADLPGAPNLGYVLAGVYHPGDAVVPIHDAVLSEVGTALADRLLGGLTGMPVSRMSVGESRPLRADAP